MSEIGQQDRIEDDIPDVETETAVVVIGRNEGDRLVRCLASIRESRATLIYVDSGSTDDSIANARRAGAEVVSLDLATVFTAARARNAGFECALHVNPRLKWVQFVDGDCEVVPGWINTARDFLEHNAGVAIVSGRLSERYPEHSIYNELMHADWRALPLGDVKYCGGCAMMRVTPLRDVGGFRDDLIAGEEPELCLRVRSRGWTVHALGGEMILHDAAIVRFSQWWLRALRTGYAYAQGVHLHGRSPERHWVKPLLSAVLWGLGLPLLVLLLLPAFGPAVLWLLLLYPVQVARVTIAATGSLRVRALRGAFLMLAKFPEAQGAIRYGKNLVLKRAARIIEYK